MLIDNNLGAPVSDRRRFISKSAFGFGSIFLCENVLANIRKLEGPVKIGMIADLHHDVMHDGDRRLKSFLKAMKNENPDAVIQLGDFAYPNKKNNKILENFQNSNPNAFHVLGNHDVDDGHSFDEVVKLWGMKGRYYSQDVNGLKLIVLDGNEKSPDHTKGYPSYMGEAQLVWLKNELEKLEGPIIIFSHQPIAGPWSIDNAKEVQEILQVHRSKIILALNGHTHIDHVFRKGGIIYFHINSASYQWVGGKHRHKSYPEDIHAKHPYIEYTCPYKDSLFTTLTLDPSSSRIDIEGRSSEWVGPSPAQVGKEMHEQLTDGEEVCPRIRSRRLIRSKN
ncbi:metallophosphoesterase [Verrucomicrobia bacterium]|nr:metallophosphoesterase [Verrucomicrobiota bacterium]